MNHLQEIECLMKKIPSDFGGGSPLEKVSLMSHLMATNRYKTYIEIGVYRGKSFLPLAYTAGLHGGKSYGIDPYAKADAYESDVSPVMQQHIDKFIEETDFDQIYSDVLRLIDDANLQNTSNILRLPSQDAVKFFREQNISIGMLHIDGNHDTHFVMQDVEFYTPLVQASGIVVLDDTDWDSVKPAYAWLQSRMTVLFEGDSFAILINREDGEDLHPLKQELFFLYETLVTRTRLSAIEMRLDDANKSISDSLIALQALTLSQATIQDANVAETNNSMEKCSALENEIRRLEVSYRELKVKYHQARNVIESAKAWQRHSWFKRAFHRWRSPNLSEM